MKQETFEWIEKIRATEGAEDWCQAVTDCFAALHREMLGQVRAIAEVRGIYHPAFPDVTLRFPQIVPVWAAVEEWERVREAFPEQAAVLRAFPEMLGVVRPDEGENLRKMLELVEQYEEERKCQSH